MDEQVEPAKQDQDATKDGNAKENTELPQEFSVLMRLMAMCLLPLPEIEKMVNDMDKELSNEFHRVEGMMQEQRDGQAAPIKDGPGAPGSKPQEPKEAPQGKCSNPSPQGQNKPEAVQQNQSDKKADAPAQPEVAGKLPIVQDECVQYPSNENKNPEVAETQQNQIANPKPDGTNTTVTQEVPSNAVNATNNVETGDQSLPVLESLLKLMEQMDVEMDQRRVAFTIEDDGNQPDKTDKAKTKKSSDKRPENALFLTVFQSLKEKQTSANKKKYQHNSQSPRKALFAAILPWLDDIDKEQTEQRQIFVGPSSEGKIDKNEIFTACWMNDVDAVVGSLESRIEKLYGNLASVKKKIRSLTKSKL